MCAGVTRKAGSVILRATSVHLFHVCPAVSWLTGQLLGKRFLILNYTSPRHTHHRSLPLPWSSHDSLQVSEDPVCIPTHNCLPLQNKFLKKRGRVSSRTGTPVLFTFQPLFLNISSTLPRILSLSKLSTCKTLSSGFASYPHTQSIFKSGRNQGFPLMEERLVFPGSTTSEFKESLPCFLASSPSLYILERRKGGPLGTSVRWLVHGQSGSACGWWGAVPTAVGRLQRSGTQSQPSVQTVPGQQDHPLCSKGKAAAAGIDTWFVLLFSFTDLICEPKLILEYISGPASAVKYPPHFNILANC